jgi:hypothetical protein
VLRPDLPATLDDVVRTALKKTGCFPDWVPLPMRWQRQHQPDQATQIAEVSVFKHAATGLFRIFQTLPSRRRCAWVASAAGRQHGLMEEDSGTLFTCYWTGSCGSAITKLRAGVSIGEMVYCSPTQHPIGHGGRRDRCFGAENQSTSYRASQSCNPVLTRPLSKCWSHG